jgi:hypothetical protein
MAGLDEMILREYFELNGFLVRQLRKYQVHSRRKLAEEEFDLLIYNPSFRVGGRKPDFFLKALDLSYVHRAVVVVKGWHTTLRFTPRMLQNSSEILGFLEENVLKAIDDLFVLDTEDKEASGDLLKILVIPGLPEHEPQRSESIRLLKEKGVDAIISFRSVLLELINRVKTHHTYEKSDVLQVLRLLKNYDLIKDPQMELFKGELL